MWVAALVCAGCAAPPPVPPGPDDTLPPPVADAAGLIRVDLGALSPAPSLFGDAGGFIVDQHFLLSAAGAVDRAPAVEVPGARVFHRRDPGGDAITLDGERWLPLGATVLSA